MATAARIESIENAMSARVIDVTVPQKLRSHPPGVDGLIFTGVA